MIDLGTVKPGSTVRIPFSTFKGSDGSALTMTNFAAADILVYKDGSTTERASTSGYTATTDFDTKTGKQLAIIDLSDNTTADFWAAGSEYLVAIDAVTVDAVTTGGWIGRFRIGYPNALHDTTIATLSSQTSFTLAAGPADNNALVGCVALIHDAASAVQRAIGVVSAYTGSTLTVTLAADPGIFTMAAKDNISFFMPGNEKWMAQTVLTGRDIGASVLLSTGTGTGQLDFTSGRVKSDMTYVNSVAYGSSTLNTLASHDPGATIGTSTLTQAQVTGGAYALSTDANGRIRIVDGTGVGEIDTNGGAIVTVTSVTNQLTAAAIATGVWQDSTAGDFTAASSIGKSLYTAGVVPGGSGGLLISGSNSGTTTLGALTITGATTHTGNVVLSDGLTISAPSTLNRAGITITGNGSGAGIITTGGSTGNGFTITGGASGHGLAVTGVGTTKHGIIATGSATTGAGLNLVGGGTSGDGLLITTTSGHGMSVTATGASKHGAIFTGGDSGTSDGFKVAAGTGGVGFRLDTLTASGAITLSGAVSLGSTLGVTGAITASNASNNIVGIDVAKLAGTAYGSADFSATMKTSITAAVPTATAIRNAVTGGAYALDTDANGRIRIVDGTAAGELDTASGKVFLSGTQTFDNTGTWTGNITGNLSGSVGSVTAAVTLPTIPANWITAAGIAADADTEIAGAVWDLATAGHTTSGTFGAAMAAAGAAGDPWSTSLPAAYGAGTAGYIVGTNIDAAITSRMATYSQPTGFLAATFPGTVASPTNITALGANSITRATFAADTGLQTVRSNTATAGGGAQITLDASASSTDGAYVGMRIDLTGGTGVGGTGVITSYNGTTKVAVIATAWTLGSPTSGTTYAIKSCGVDLETWHGLEPNDLTTGQVEAFAASIANSAITTNTFDTACDFTATMKTSITAAVPTATAIRNAVTGGAYALDTDANGRVRIVDGTAAGELDTNAGKVLLAATQAFDNTGTWTGNITGNLSGSVGSVSGAVGSVTGAVGSIASGGIAAASIATAAAEKLADITLRRTPTNIEASSFGDTLGLGSLYGLIQQAQKSDTTTHAGKLTVFKVNGTTELGQLTITTSPTAEPITSAL